MAQRLDKQVTGNVGLYYCCYQLSLRGWNVMPTARNAKGVDIIIYNADATEYLGIQVKTLSARVDVPLGSSISNIMSDFWVNSERRCQDPEGIHLDTSTGSRWCRRKPEGRQVILLAQPKVLRAGTVCRSVDADWVRSSTV